MTLTRPAGLLTLLLGLFLSAGVARADQLQLLSRADAQRAARALPASSLFVDWISHLPGSQPVLKRVLKVEVKPWGDPSDGYFEVVARTKVVGTATRRANAFETPWDWQLEEDGAEASAPLDLAYVFVPSRELENTFICLGKRLKLPCEVDSIALEVAGRVLFEVASAAQPTTRGLTGGLGEPSGRHD